MTQAASLAVSGLLLSIAAGLAVARTLPDWLTAALRAAPLVVFVGGALLGLLLRRGQLALGLAVLALADLALVQLGERAVFDAVGLLLPLNLGVIAWLGEASLFTAPGAAGLGAILLQVAVVAWLRRPELAAVTASLEQPLVAPDLVAWTTLPHLALVAFAVALGVVLARFCVDRRSLAGGAAWALVAAFLALDAAGAGRPARVHLVIAGLLLVAGASLEPRRVAFRDPMTGLPGRLALHAALRRLPRRYALARVDIDDYRRFRDDHGGEAAARMLRRVASELAKVGGGGRAFSCEGPAFAIVFPRTAAAAAAGHLEIVRRAVHMATLDVRVPERPRGDRSARPSVVERTVAVTISVGIAQPERSGADPHDVLRAAERALDRAKEAGQNRVVVGPSTDEGEIPEALTTRSSP